jgi:hypothetical protein
MPGTTAMIKSLIQLVPFGIDEDSRIISGFYLANIGSSQGYNPGGLFDYLVAYFEKPSRFNEFKQTEYYRLVTEWDNSQSTFVMLHEVFQDIRLWCNADELKNNWDSYTAYEKAVILQFQKRAKEDGIL